MSLERFANAFLKTGRFRYIDWRGEVRLVGPEDCSVVATIRFKTQRAMRSILFNPAYAIGAVYADGELEVTQGSLADVLTVFIRDRLAGSDHPSLALFNRLLALLKPIHGMNTLAKARRDVSSHYDLDADFYASWLDDDMHYSAAYFTHDNATLEEAQQAKSALIARKLRLRPGMEVLEIGSGWGSLAMYLAQHHGVRVTGLTLSRAQLERARKRARARGLEERVIFELQDYREEDGRYDRVVSVGMLEHVGAPKLGEFFATVYACMKPNAVALIHTIGRTPPPGVTNPWIRRHIFPGGYIPSLSEIAQAVEPSRLLVTDVDVWRLHYAKTIAEWRRRFEAVRDEVIARFDERFYRMWMFYLSASEASFRSGVHVNFQVQLCSDVEVLPLTRNYLFPTPQGGDPDDAASFRRRSDGPYAAGAITPLAGACDDSPKAGGAERRR